MAEQLGLEQMPKPLRAVTPAKVDSFDSCPRKFRYTYIDRPPPPRGAPWAHTGIGSAVHNALKALWDLPIERRNSAAAVSELRAQWPAVGFRDPQQRSRARDIVGGWLASYVETMDLRDQPRGIERTVGAPYGDLSISGRVDRIDEILGPDGPELVVVDYKTGRAVPTEDDARSSMQLALYAVAARRTFRTPCRRVELHHIPSGVIAAAEHTDETLHRQLRRVAYTADDIETAKERLLAGVPADEAYPARPGPACGHCDFRAACPEGRAAAPARDPWFAVPEDPEGGIR